LRQSCAARSGAQPIEPARIGGTYVRRRVWRKRGDIPWRHDSWSPRRRHGSLFRRPSRSPAQTSKSDREAVFQRRFPMHSLSRTSPISPRRRPPGVRLFAAHSLRILRKCADRTHQSAAPHRAAFRQSFQSFFPFDGGARVRLSTLLAAVLRLAANHLGDIASRGASRTAAATRDAVIYGQSVPPATASSQCAIGHTSTPSAVLTDSSP
jgi:hypothetical protein